MLRDEKTQEKIRPFSKMLKEMRKQLGLTQRKMSDQLGVVERTVRAIENLEAFPTSETQEKIKKKYQEVFGYF